MAAQRIVVVGDSIAYGLGDERGLGWSGLLQRKHLDLDPFNNRYYNLSIPGIGSTEVRRIIRLEVPLRNPDLVLLAYGINDARRLGSRSGPFPMDLDRCVEFFKANIEDLRSQGRAVQTVGLIKPDTSRTMPLLGAYFDTAPAFDLETKLAEACKQLTVPRINLWNLFDDHSTHLMDGLHPDSAGHHAIYRTISQELSQM